MTEGSEMAALSRARTALKRLDLSGIFPPIATPFDADGTIAYDRLEANVQRWQRSPFKGYVVQVREIVK